MTDTPLLELRGVSKHFGAVIALHEVDLRVYPGCVTALVGDNGAGKSTLIKSVAGNLDVVQNMFLGREELEPLRTLDEIKMEARARDTLQSLSVTTIRSVRQTVAGLSGGQRQSVAVAKAVMWNSRLVILDEPTAALGVAQTRQVLDLVKRLAEQGLGVVIVSHNLHDIFEVADNITVLRLGQNVAEFKRRDVTQEQVVHAITAGKLAKVPGQLDTAEEVVA